MNYNSAQTKNSLILLIILFSIISCEKNLKECQTCETNKDKNEIYFRAKAIDRHPKLEKRLHDNNYFEFYSTVNIYSLSKEVDLKEIVDTQSFRKINNNYFEDKEFIYFVPQNLTNNYLNILDKKENVKFSKNKDTIFSAYGTFYKGVLIRNSYPIK